MSVLPNCIKCVDKSTKDKLTACLNSRPPNNIGYPYDLARLGYIWCTVDGCNYLADADRLCDKYRGIP